LERHPDVSRFYEDGPFEDCPLLDDVCVPSGYKSYDFCGHSVCKSDHCASFFSGTNQCYGASCSGDTVTISKRYGISKWDDQNDACAEYFCDNESGLLNRPICNSTGGKTMVCTPRECYDGGSIRNEGIVVEATFKTPQDIYDVQSQHLTDEIQSFGIYYSIYVDGVIPIMDEKGRVSGLFIILDHYSGSSIAVPLAQKLNEIGESADCSVSVLCEIDHAVALNVPISSLSSSTYGSDSSTYGSDSSSYGGGSSNYSNNSSMGIVMSGAVSEHSLQSCLMLAFFVMFFVIYFTH